jgi:hypothetical protein
MSQTKEILSHLERVGSITAIEALNEYGCFRLAARIKDLRDAGHNIYTDNVDLPNGKTIAKYTLIQFEV